MTQDEAKAVAEAVVAALDRPSRPRTAPAPKPNGTLRYWATLVGVVLGAMVAAGTVGSFFVLGKAEAVSADQRLKVEHDSDMIIIDGKIELRDERMESFQREVRKDFRALGRAVGAKMDPLPPDDP